MTSSPRTCCSTVRRARKDVVAKVSDFGIARLVDSPRLTGTFNYIGTPHYCAPEIANGAAATPAVDVYAAGVMLYELVAGQHPVRRAGAVRGHQAADGAGAAALPADSRGAVVRARRAG